MQILTRPTWRPSPPVLAQEDCTVCQGTGWVLLPRSGRAHARRCQCSSLARLIKLKESVRIPSRYEHCSLDNYVPRTPSQNRALSEARLFAGRYPEVRRGLLFSGGPGVGKTHLMVGIIRDLVHRFREDVLFVDFDSALRSIQLHSPSTNGECDWDRLSRVALLAVDNLGLCNLDYGSIRALHQLVSARSRAKKLTLYTGEGLRRGELWPFSQFLGTPHPDYLLPTPPSRLLMLLLSGVKHIPMGGSDYRQRSEIGSRLF